ncbi:MAG: DUF3108 domain-containing protein [Myxococcota bacterium]
MLGVLSALLLLPEPASATPPPSSPTSESSVFAVTWGRARLARIDLKLGCPSRGIRPAALLATSEGFTEQIRPFRVRFDTFLDSSSRRSRQGRTSITEKGRTRAYRTSFRERDSSAIVHATIFGQTREPKTIAFASSPDDMLSWMLRARQELAFARDTTAHFLVWDGWKSFWLRMTVERIERIATPSGSYKAWRVRLERAIVRASERATTTPTSRDFPFERIAIAWFARAEGHPLLGMNYDAPIGTTRIRLSSYTRRACSKTPP